MTKSYEELLDENKALSAKNEELHRSLDESQELLRAISSGEVDALILTGSEGEQVYTLEGADRAYRVLIEAMNDGAVTMTSDGTILYCNRHFADMVRSSLEKVIGSSIYRFIPQSDQTAFRILQQRLGRGELTLRAEDESIMPVYISINALKLSESQEAFCVVVTDLTEQKHKEEIVAAEKLARSIIEQATEAIAVCDEEGKIIRFSNAVLRILGCDPSLQSFEDLFNLHLPMGGTLSPVSMALRGKVLLHVEASFKRTDGLQFHLLLNSGPLKSSDGKIIGCVVTLTDITERNRAEEAAKIDERRLQSIIKITQHNPKSTWELLDYALDEAIALSESKLGYILYYSEETQKFTLHAWSKEAMEECSIPHPPTIFQLDNTGIWGEVVRQRRPIVINDFQAPSPLKKGYPKGHAHLTRFMSVPVFIDNRIVAVVAVANKSSDYSDQDVSQLSMMMESLWTIAERKRSEEALAAAHRQIQSIIDNTPAVVYAFDLEERFVLANTTLAELLNSTPEQMIGKRRHEFMPKEDADWHEANDRQVIEAGRALEFEEYSQLKGRSITWLTTKFPLRDVQGRIYAVAGISADITERKRAEEELKKQAALIDLSPDSIMVRKMDGTITFWSQGAESLYGWTKHEAIGQQSHALLKTQFPQPLEQIIEQVQQTGYWSGELIHSTKDSRQVIVQSRWQAKFDDRGNVKEILESNVDITERKRAEVALQKAKEELEVTAEELRLQNEELVNVQSTLRESEERYRTRFNALIEGFCVIEMVFDEANRPVDYRFLEINPAFEGQTGLHDAQGKLMRDLAPEHEDYWFKIYGKIVLTGEPARFENEARALNRWYEVRAFRVGGQESRKVAICFSDITQRKRAEEALRKAKDDLELRVQERTAELVKAKEAAEAAARAKSEFLANMSHEIRTPMNAIIGMTGLMLEEPLDPLQRENLELVRTNGDALLSIINDILDFSKMESDKVVLEEQPFNPRQCVEESIDLVAIKAAEKGLNLAYTIDKEVPETTIGDPGRLRQVLGNLLSNAVKFTDEGDVTLSVSVEEPNEIHFAVQDTGIGIPQGNMHQLFQPFSQMEPSTTRLYGGTGLGLAISKKLVEMMGGRIWAESAEGIGSTFHFTTRASSRSEPQINAVPPQLIGKHVLIVEDNKTNRRILSKQVYDWGMIPITVASGEDALKYIQRGDDFDIAILDMDLVDMTGLELEEEIRKYNNTLPLVFLTSLGKRIPPGHAYLTKPIKPSQLQKVLTDILSNQPARRHVTSPAFNQAVQNSPLRILLAEDNVSSQKVAQQMLRRLGYKVDTVANGIEALQALERQHYDVVLMDVKMPEMDGLEATRIIRQRWPDNGPKIIAITAYALQGDREKCLEAGMDGYISKPVRKEDLAKVLEKHSQKAP